MRIGLVGFPGTGRTTVFNALTGLTAETGVVAHPGRTNLGAVRVPDPRLARLAELRSPKKVTPAEITFVDVAGTGSARDLERNTLNSMREAEALCQVLRAFDNPLLGDEPPDPLRELEDLYAEMLIADQELVERRLERLEKESDHGPEFGLLGRLMESFEAEQALRTLELNDQERRRLSGFQFLTSKPMLLVLNVDVAAAADPVPPEIEKAAADKGFGIVVMSARDEMEIARMPPEEQGEYLQMLGLREPSTARFVHAAFSALGLITMFTLGDAECRAWSIPKGIAAQPAAGKIHTDMERGFIRVEIIRWDDLLAHRTEAKCREAGLLRIEGKTYVIQDGDCAHFLFNV